MELRPSKRGDPACSAVLLGGSGRPPRPQHRGGGAAGTQLCLQLQPGPIQALLFTDAPRNAGASLSPSLRLEILCSQLPLICIHSSIHERFPLLLFHLYGMHSLAAYCMRPGQGSNLQPWPIGCCSSQWSCRPGLPLVFLDGAGKESRGVTAEGWLWKGSRMRLSPSARVLGPSLPFAPFYSLRFWGPRPGCEL